MSAVRWSLMLGLAAPLAAQQFMIYVGTYTGPRSQGIYSFRFDAATGKIKPLGLAAATDNPSFLAIHPSRHFLYAVNESDNGAISAFAIDRRSGGLAFLNRVPSRGNGPCHLAVEASGKRLFAANYGSGSVAACPIAEDGRVGEDCESVQHAGSSIHPRRQGSPHPHQTVLSPDGRFLFVPDLGLDRVFVYATANRTLAANGVAFTQVRPGLGPRHLAFSPDGRFAYVLHELGSSIQVFGYDPRIGSLRPLSEVSTLRQDFTGENTAGEIEVHPGGRFVYASNRGDDSLAVFHADAATGGLTFVQRISTRGRTPRHFAIDLTGRWLLAANQESDNLVLFQIDPRTGRLLSTGETVSAPSPASIVFAGRP
ncbi:MAG TPA: lactonase family protein [Bryobacteraceae bacterium]|nr:lactonase family protein [Bryobacteraceae bacterium]